VWRRLNGWGMVRPRCIKARWGEGPSLAIIAILFFKNSLIYIWLSVSIRKVASEYLFCVLIYMNFYAFHIDFMLFVFLSNTYLIFDFFR